MGREGLTRREMLKIGTGLAASLGVSLRHAKLFAEGLARLSGGLPRLLWLQGQACAGCSVSWLNAENPTILQAITERLTLAFHPTLSAAQGRLAWEVIEKVQTDAEPFILVIEGAIPARMPEACRIGGRPLAEVLAPLAKRARYLVAAGTCASHGGIPCAEGNPTGAVSLQEFAEKSGIGVPGRLVHCPGCPVHPDELLATLLHLAAKGYPEVRPGSLTPTLFGVGRIHDECPRVSMHTLRVFATQFGDGYGCLYALGCQGLDVYADCQRRKWNGGVNWCIDAGAPCIGCKEPQFAKSRSLPFYRKGGEQP